MSVYGHNSFWGTNMSEHSHVCAQSCLGTNVWANAQTCLGTNMSRHSNAWAQSRGHNHVWAKTCLGTVMWSTSCGHNHVWAQTWWNPKAQPDVRMIFNDI